MRGYALKDHRIVTLKNTEHCGIAPSRNKLIAIARGKYIVWQDADDVSLADRIKHQYGFMEDHEGIGICGGGIEFFYGNHGRSIRMFSRDDTFLRKRIFCYSPVSQPASIVRRSIMDRVGKFDESLPQAEDLDMSVRIGTCSQFANLPEIVLRYRYDEDSLSHKRIRENIMCTLLVRKRARRLGYAHHFFDRLVNAATCGALLFPASPDRFMKLFDAFRSFDLEHYVKNARKEGHV
jgi:glycosyltransferase involved in cell wall biosynthesis